MKSLNPFLENKASKIVVVKNENECNQYNTTYFLENSGAYLRDYKHNGLHFRILLDPILNNDSYYVSIYTKEYKFSNLEGINHFPFLRNIKQMIADIKQHNPNFKKLIFDCIDNPYTVSDVQTAQLLMQKYGFPFQENSGAEIITDLFYALEKNNPLTPDEQKIIDILKSKSSKSARDVAKKIRFTLFYKLMKRAFQTQKTIFIPEISLKNLKPEKIIGSSFSVISPQTNSLNIWQRLKARMKAK